jgi:hypothetical protein
MPATHGPITVAHQLDLIPNVVGRPIALPGTVHKIRPDSGAPECPQWAVIMEARPAGFELPCTPPPGASTTGHHVRELAASRRVAASW